MLDAGGAELVVVDVVCPYTGRHQPVVIVRSWWLVSSYNWKQSAAFECRHCEIG